jgi:hypothetical protein
VERDEEDDELVRTIMAAADGERYILLCECGGYPNKAPSAVFVNDEGWSSDVTAWPSGNAAFVEQVKPPEAGFICIPLTRECLSYHPDWKCNEEVGGWDPEKHTLLDLFAAVQRLLHSSDYIGREQSVLRRNIVVPETIVSRTIEGIATRPTGTHTALAVWVGHRVPKRQLVDDVVFLDQFPMGLALAQALRERHASIIAQIHRAGSEVSESKTARLVVPIHFSAGVLALWLSAEQRELTVAGSAASEYLGDGKWRTLDALELHSRFTIE